MKIESPKDKSRATASINWITRQLKGKGVENLRLRAYWPKRIPMTSASLSDATENPAVLISEGISELPVYLEIIRIVDLAARFKGSKTFVEDCSKEFPAFYQDVGQHLSKWVAPAPKVKELESQPDSIPETKSDAHAPMDVSQKENSNPTENEPNNGN